MYLELIASLRYLAPPPVTLNQTTVKLLQRLAKCHTKSVGT